MTAVSVPARPKINLFLHVTGKQADGYHTLESLAVFAETGDRVRAESCEGLSLSIDGPFASTLDAGEDNLVLRAARALQDWMAARGQSAPGAALHLIKHLPIASGIGGGSADAAAALNALVQLWALEIDHGALADLALGLGADVPVCLESRPRIMRGIGDKLADAPVMPPAWMVLANPGRQVSTPVVFAKLDAVRSAPVTLPDRFTDAAALANWLSHETRNDLELSARALVPEIRDVLAALNARAPLLARMSGSGATCFGLFGDRDAALAAKVNLRDTRPDWWIEVAAVST